MTPTTASYTENLTSSAFLRANRHHLTEPIRGGDPHPARPHERVDPDDHPDRRYPRGAHVAETADLAGYPPGSRLIVRREPLHPGAQQTFDDEDGHRFTVALTDQPDADLAVLDQRHRAHARVEQRIRDAKDSGLANLPSADFQGNTIWLQLVLAA